MSTLRVDIEPPTQDDREALLEAVRSSRTLHGQWITPPSTDEAFAAYLKRLSSDDHAGFLVRLRSTRDIAGVINMNNIIHGGFHSAFLGFYAMDPFAGQGYMKQGLRLVLSHAFECLELHRVEANIQPENRASIALVRSCGFRKEGFSPKYLKVGDEWRDHERWALLSDEFE